MPDNRRLPVERKHFDAADFLGIILAMAMALFMLVIVLAAEAMMR